MNHPLLEICVDGPDGLAAAIAGGADRIELCAALEVGGLTPSAALVAAGVAGGVPVHAMVRPRGGDFLYSAAEAALMVDEVERMRDAGVAGVVVGALDDRGGLDLSLLARLRAAATGIAITLHRAIDLVADPVAAVRQAGELEYDLILTSGGAHTAIEGAATIARMFDAAPSGLAIVAGSGVNAGNVAALIRDTRVRQVHASGSAPALPTDPRLDAMGFAVGQRRVTDRKLVATLKAALIDG